MIEHMANSHFLDHPNYNHNHSTYNGMSGSLRSISPSASMGRIEGRLRLCSRSIVFEPTDTSRAIIRCPLHRMDCAPIPDTRYHATTAKTNNANQNNYHNNFHDSIGSTMRGDDAGNSNDNGNVAIIKSNRHLTMKANNVIAPFEMISIPVVFRFQFSHFSPDLFFELSNVSYYGLIIVTTFFNFFLMLMLLLHPYLYPIFNFFIIPTRSMMHIHPLTMNNILKKDAFPTSTKQSNKFTII